MRTRRFTFSAHLVVTGLLAAALVLSWVRPSAGDDAAKGPPVAAPAAGQVPLPAYRYQLIPVDKGAFAVIDTRTGRTWTRYMSGGWSDHGVPPGAQAD
jgi:hypothetical protein